MVRAPDLSWKGCGFESLQEWQGRVFFSRANFLCWLLFRYPFHPRVTAVAHKRPRSFCQKCRWQVTAKYACTLHMWLCMKCMVMWCTLNAPRWQQFHVAPCQRCKWIFKNALSKTSHSFRITCEHSECSRSENSAIQKRSSSSSSYGEMWLCCGQYLLLICVKRFVFTRSVTLYLTGTVCSQCKKYTKCCIHDSTKLTALHRLA